MKLIDKIKQAFTPIPIADPIMSRRGFLTVLGGLATATATGCGSIIRQPPKPTILTEKEQLFFDMFKEDSINSFDPTNFQLIKMINEVDIYPTVLESSVGGQFDTQHNKIYINSSVLNGYSIDKYIFIHETLHFIWDNYLESPTKKEFTKQVIILKDEFDKGTKLKIPSGLENLFSKVYINYTTNKGKSKKDFCGTEVFARVGTRLARDVVYYTACQDYGDFNHLKSFYKNILRDEGGCLK